MHPFITAILLLIAATLMATSLARRFLPLLVMQPDIRWDQPGRRFTGMIAYTFGQLRFLGPFERFHGTAHILIFWGAVIVTLNTIHVIGRGFSPEWYLPGFDHTRLGLAYVFLKDLFTLAVMIGCGMAFYNRVFNRPSRMILSAEALVILAWIFGMMAMDFLYESSLFLMNPAHWEQRTAFLGVFGSHLLSGMGFTGDDPQIARLHAIGFWGHLLLAFSFLNYLPYCKQFHEITALPAVFMRSLKPRGLLTKQDFTREDILFGVGKIEDYSWKRGLDMYTCAECGRCQANCPAHLTGKPLSPMRVILDQRNHLREKTPVLWRAAVAKFRNKVVSGKLSEADENDALIGPVISPEAVWSCTTCGHCITNCPLLIEHVDTIIDLRRQLVQVESRFPREVVSFFKGCENMSNPWGLASNSRGDWLDVSGVKSAETNPGFEYLFYVGCAGSFDDRTKKTTRAMAGLMRRAGVNFACLGNEEMCCGETARRLGNEYLAQEMIANNIEQWNSLGVRKIVTACPHCYNTIKNEYPQFGGGFRVIHHTEFLRELIRTGKLAGADRIDGMGSVVYHDPCYLGRYNNVYQQPREIARYVPGLDLHEAGRNRRFSFCCGGGGGRMWMEEKHGTRINRERCRELLETGAGTIATACPYCTIMLDDAVKDLGKEETVRVMDLAVMVERALGV